MTVLTNETARTDVINRLRRAEGQIRGVQRMVEEGESCLKISQQLSAVRKALDSTYLRMTMCYMEQELQQQIPAEQMHTPGMESLLKEMEGLLARIG
jgi:CsoR family transcriptional regulator, copper-sensing transcriptional repressor